MNFQHADNESGKFILLFNSCRSLSERMFSSSSMSNFLFASDQEISAKISGELL